jgi:general secretion pathway protein K
MPNQPLVEVGEIRALPGISAKAWAALAPHLSALPGATKLNINTASAEVLLCFADTDKATASLMERFVHDRERQPIRDASAASQLFSGAIERIDVKSDFFAVRAHAVYRDRHVRLETQVQRDARTGKVAILARSDAARL